MKLRSLTIFLLLFLSLTVYAQDFEIVIDGEKDAFYNTLTGPDDGWIYLPPDAFNDNGVTDPAPVDEFDLSVNWYSAWDDTYLYVYVDVVDEDVIQDNTDYYRNDVFDTKIDPDYTVDAANAEVFCFAMTCMDSADIDPSLHDGVSNIVETVGGGWVGTERPTSDDYARQLKPDDDGYILECRIKWDWIATASKGPIAAQEGEVIGFSISIHDNDGVTAEGRDNSIQWAAQLLDAVWHDCTPMGHIELLADHKIKYVPESLRDPSIVNPDPDMYVPTSTSISEELAVVKDFTLSQNYPNPFNPGTIISYKLQKMSEVKISVYDVLGNEVAILVDGVKPAGTHKISFDGSQLSSGMYIYKLQSNGTVISKKMALIK